MRRKYKNFMSIGDNLNLDKSPFYWISKIHSQHVQHVDNALKAYGLDNSRRQILLALKSNDNASISDLSKTLISKISTTTKIVHRLEYEGLVETMNCKIDGRFTRVKLTEKGEFAIQNINALNNIFLVKSLEGLSELQIEKLLVTLKHIFSRLSD